MSDRFFKLYDSLLADDRLSYPEMILYGVITRLAMNDKGRCFASNKRLSEIMNCSLSSINKWLEHLEKIGLIERTYKYLKGTRHIDRRYIKPRGIPSAVFHGDTPPNSDTSPAALQGDMPPDYEDNNINIKEKYSKNKGSKRNFSPSEIPSNNFFLKMAVKAQNGDIF